MPFVFTLVGLMLLVIGVRGKQDDALALLKSEFTGQRSFVAWVVAIFSVGSAGYIPAAKPLANAFLVLILLVIFLSNGGVFAQFNRQVLNRNGNADSAKALPALPALPSLPSLAQ